MHVYTNVYIRKAGNGVCPRLAPRLTPVHLLAESSSERSSHCTDVVARPFDASVIRWRAREQIRSLRARVCVYVCVCMLLLLCFVVGVGVGRVVSDGCVVGGVEVSPVFVPLSALLLLVWLWLLRWLLVVALLS